MLQYSRRGYLPAAKATAAKKIQSWYRKKRVMSAKKTAWTNYKRKGTWQRSQTKYGARMQIAYKKQRSQAVGTQERNFTDAFTFPMANLIFGNIIMPRNDLSGENLAAKKGQSIFLKGVRLRRQFEFLPPSEERPAVRQIICHYAILQAKDVEWGNRTQQERQAALNKDFFRTFNDYNKRCDDFEDNGTTSLWKDTQNTASINPDGDFNVITHMRRLMEQPQALDQYTPTGQMQIRPERYIWQIDKYMRLNKTVNQTRIDLNVMDFPLIEVFWYQTRTPYNYPNPTNPQVVNTWSNYVTYFKSQDSM